MFYYPNVLHRHTGCFSTIWLAATRGIRVTRRELLKVNIKRTCSNIMDYVTAQVLPPQPNLPKPRFSLYLSSQLQYGVVVVYHRQCGFLLEEIQQTIDRLLRSTPRTQIDMAVCDRLALDVSNTLHMMEEAEGAQDPFFGVMELHQLPSPYKIHQPMQIEEAGSQHSLVPSPHNTADKDGFRSPLAAITLSEKNELLTTCAECFEGADLPEATAREIDLLLDQPDQFRREVEEPPIGLERVMSSIEQLTETVLGAEQDSMWLRDKELGQSEEVDFAVADLEMTPPQVPMPTPPSGQSGEEEGRITDRGSPCEEVVVPPVRKPSGGRRRQLVFADPEVQISDKEIKEQISNTLAETLVMSEVLPDMPSLSKRAAPAQLFAGPCRSLIHADLQSLWKQSATLAVQREKNRGEQEFDKEATEESEQDREILRTERKRRQSSVREISSESGLQLTEGSSALDVILDVTKEDRSAGHAIAPVSRWSPQEEAKLPMEPIVEENIEMPEAQTDTESGDMLSWIASILQRFGEVTFDSLVPPEANRSTAAHSLCKLLELLSAGEVTAQQTEPYSNISINLASLRMDV